MPARVFEEAFLCVASVAWQYLRPDSRRVIRAACRNGRLLHDSLLTHLGLDLGVRYQGPVDSDNEDADAAPLQAPTPREVASYVSGVLQRGASLQAVTLRNWNHDEPGAEDALLQRHEEQLLAVVGAFKGFPLPALELVGAIPISVPVVNAIATCCKEMTKLTVRICRNGSFLPEEGWDPAVYSSYLSGTQQLLSGVGPRLRELQVLNSAHHWPAEAWGALRHCTGLISLTLEAGKRDPLEQNPGTQLGSVDAEAGILSAVSTLTNLRSLSLTTVVDPAACTPDALAPHASSVARLSALTALTSLRLAMSLRLDYLGDSWSQREQDGEQHDAWVAVRQAHQTAVLCVLCAMPQLQTVDCPTLWLHPSEAAPLTAVTNLSVGGLLPQPLASLVAPEAVAQQSTAATMWPPRLQELTLHSGASPRLLAVLQLPATLRTFTCHTIRFGMLDVEVSNRIKQETLDALGPAVQLLVRTKRPTAVDRMQVLADGARGLLRPRERGPRGHAEWLGQLAGLDAFSGIELSGMKLRAGDLISLVSTLPNLQDFVLRESWMPVAALPCLAGLAQLTNIWVDLSRAVEASKKELEAAVCVLCHQAARLSQVVVKVPSGYADMCIMAVAEQLEATGRDYIQVHFFDD